MVSTELIDVLFWNKIKEFLQFYKELNEKYYPDRPEQYSEEFNMYLVDKIKNKANFIKTIDEYNANGKAIWQEQEAQYCDILGKNDIVSALQRGTRGNGERFYFIYQEMVKKWAYHLDEYAKAVNNSDNIKILELATGAGLGTCAVIKELLPNNRMISIDIDFEAARNADGLAQYFNVSDRVCGLNANFWFLPFENGLFDTVCTHYGLDESREVPTVLKEVSRVLKRDGYFVVIARKNPYDRHRNTMNMFNITESECNPLLKKARLYSGFDDLVCDAKENGLILIKHKDYEPENSHHRILFIFQKR